MSALNPIQRFQDLFYNTSIEDVQSDADVWRLEKEIGDAVQTLVDYVWENTVHDYGSAKPEIFSGALSCSYDPSPLSDGIEEELASIDNALSNLGMPNEVVPIFPDNAIWLPIEHRSLNEYVVQFATGDIPDSEKLAKLRNLQESFYEAAMLANKYMAQILSQRSVANFELQVQEKEAISTFFTDVDYDTDQLGTMYRALIKKRWIDKSTREEDFVYVFSGEGEPPTSRIKWNETSILLACFLATITGGRNRWSKASKVFAVRSDNDNAYHPVSRDAIKANYSNALNNDTDAYQDNINKVKELLSSITAASISIRSVKL